MLRTLSRRNAKRQVTDYVIYIMTLVITVALLLSFNMIIFSKEIDAVIKEKSILPLMIIGVSMVVVVIMSTLVNYITIFMLKRRGNVEKSEEATEFHMVFIWKQAIPAIG